MKFLFGEARDAGSRTAVVLLFVTQILFIHAASAGNFYAGTTPSNVPWTNGFVPYEFTNSVSLTPAMKQTYLDGLREWELAANVKFIPHTNQSRWILFTYNTNYLDNVSPGYNPQVVTVDNLSRSQVAHEMGHSFGFTHENIRTDKTNFLTVLSNNVTPGSLGWFQIDPASVTNGAYDFESVMHLSRDFASTQPGVLDTQLALPPYARFQPRMGNLCLSPADRAALRFLYGPPLIPLTNIVTTTADAGFGSLRAAMYYATDHPGTPVKFNIPITDPGYSNGVFNIHLSGDLPPLATNSMVIDGSTQPGFTNSPLIFVDGSQILPDPRNSHTGLLIYSANNQVKNLSFSGFNWNGLTLLYADATNNAIAGCWLGLDASGTNAAPNAYQGILIDNGSSQNTIGGTNALARNVISGNTQHGIWISGTNTAGNAILGNYIGTGASGTNAVGNLKVGMILAGGTTANVVGGANALARNVLSGNNEYGVWISGSNTTGNVVLGNYIGIGANGTNPLANIKSGVFLGDGANANIIGATNTLGRNIISGNHEYGIWISDPNTTGNAILGNYVGTDVSGAKSLGNALSGVNLEQGAATNVIGGTNVLARNVISGNGEYGIRMSDANTTGNSVLGNYIGTDATGMASIGNIFGGMILQASATANVIGGASTNARNIISGNASFGLWVASDKNIVQGNFISLNANGTAAVPNTFVGLYVLFGARSNLVTGNVLSGNNSEGIRLAGAGTSGNVVQGNFIGTDVTGTLAIPNYFAGLTFLAGATSNSAGGLTATARNVISGNGSYGVVIGDTNTIGNTAQGNFVGVSANGTTALPNSTGVLISNGAQSNTVGGVSAGTGNIISGNYSAGLEVRDPGTSGNLVQGNYLGTGTNGAAALGNSGAGVVIHNGAFRNVIGLNLDGSGAGNLIAFSGQQGVRVDDTNTFGNSIRGNSIYTNSALGIDLSAPSFSGVTPNDIGDGDLGPNNLQNYPVITNAVASTSTTLISGKLNSTANGIYLIDIYRNPAADPSGYGEGQTYVGAVTVTNNGSGNSGFTLTATGNLASQLFTATATDKATGDTSEFSFTVPASNGPVAPKFIGPIALTTTGFIAKLSLTIGQSYRVQATTNLGTNPIPWLDLTNFTAAATNFNFLDRVSTNIPRRFYRAISP